MKKGRENGPHGKSIERRGEERGREQRCIQFFVRLTKAATETVHMMQEGYSKVCMAQAIFFHWH
jgi:hypothetical protein